MARITVEDCVIVVPNRFELCLIASNRAKSILSGSATSLERKEKPSVIALREIADELVDVKNVRSNIIRSIKNTRYSDYNQLLTNNQSSEIFQEEIESQNLVLKDNLFLDDNIEIDD